MTSDSRPRSRPRGTHRSAAAGAVFGLAAATLAGCSEGEEPDPGAFSDADVEYATSVAVHHAQSVQLLNLSLRQLDAGPAVGPWVDSARSRHLRELEELEALLDSWDQDVPDTGLEHSDEGGQVRYDSSIPGVLSPDEVKGIAQSSGDRFIEEWLRGLLDHELGAVRLAEAEAADGQDAEAVEFAEKERETHSDQAEKLRRMLTP